MLLHFISCFLSFNESKFSTHTSPKFPLQTNEMLGSLSLQRLVCTIRLTLLTTMLEYEFPKEAAHAVFDSAFMIYT